MSYNVQREHVCARILRNNRVILRAIALETTLEAETNLITVFGQLSTTAIVLVEPTATSTLPVATDTILLTCVSVCRPSRLILQHVSSIEIQPCQQLIIKFAHHALYARRIIQGTSFQKHATQSLHNISHKSVLGIKQELLGGKQLVNVFQLAFDDTVIIDNINGINLNISNHGVGSQLLHMHNQALAGSCSKCISIALPEILIAINGRNAHVAFALCQACTFSQENVNTASSTCYQTRNSD